tara:strand:+ start:575 stop:739 length:165 start_codon:yes stop_codon:yes gene_type:complete
MDKDYLNPDGTPIAANVYWLIRDEYCKDCSCDLHTENYWPDNEGVCNYCLPEFN